MSTPIRIKGSVLIKGASTVLGSAITTEEIFVIKTNSTGLTMSVANTDAVPVSLDEIIYVEQASNYMFSADCLLSYGTLT